MVLDLLSVHLVRNINGSTIISYHPSSNIQATTAQILHERIRIAGASKLIINFHSLIQPPGQSLHWKGMIQKSQDPTLVLYYSYGTLCMHGMRPWKIHMSIFVRWWVSLVVDGMYPDLQTGRARYHDLNYYDHYTRHINFIKNTPNPAMDGVCEVDRIRSANLLRRECDNLLDEIELLYKELSMQERRLKKAMDLVSHINSVCRIHFLILAIGIRLCHYR